MFFVAALGGTFLNSFVVGNRQDRDLFYKTLKKNKVPVPNIVTAQEFKDAGWRPKVLFSGHRGVVSDPIRS